MVEKIRIEQLRLWRQESADDLERAKQDLAGAQRRVDEAREKLTLLERLLVVEGDEPMTNHARRTPLAGDLLDSCERLMREAGRPLHIRELHAALLKEGLPLPGRGTEANLIVRLQRSNGRFLRTGRGTYAPATFGVPEHRPTRRRRISQASGN